MAREEKQSEGSGSALLGAELRRLRGTRTLEEIASLTRSPPLAGIVPPMAVTTLSEIELGHQLPRVTTLYTLSMIYRVSMNQLMGYVIEESMAAAQVPPEGTTEELTEKFNRLLSIAEWHRALPIAIALEKRADSDGDRVRWRGNRATCMAQMGLANEAVALFISCIESPGLSRRREFTLLHSLASTLMSAGQFKTAARMAKDALENAPEDVPPEELASTCALRAELLVCAEELAQRPHEALLREAIRLADRASELRPDDRPLQIRLRLRRARAYRLMGNLLFAQQEFSRTRQEASHLGYAHMEGLASLELGRLAQASGDRAAAEKLYNVAARCGEKGQLVLLQFDAFLEMFKLLRDERPEAAAAYYRRCKALIPLLPTDLPSVREFSVVAAGYKP